MRDRLPSNEVDAFFHPVTWIIIAAVIVVAALVGALFTSVGQNEIVIRDCGDDQTVWRYPRDEGAHWDGFCGTETYSGSAARKFNEPIVVDGVHYSVRGTAKYELSHLSDAQLIELHRRHGSADALFQATVMSPIRLSLQEAAADPDWAQPQGGFVSRKLKGALEYGLKRISPTGHIWTAPETRQALEKELNRRLLTDAPEPGIWDKPREIPITVTLGFVTER